MNVTPMLNLVRRRSGWLVVGIIALGATLIYWNTFSAPFVLDDLTSIKANPTIRRLWPPGPVLTTPRGTGDTVDGRPLLNLSFAFNYAAGGDDPRGYHLVNLCIHVLNGCLLFGILRRTLVRPAIPAGAHAGAAPLAAVGAILWTLHPLATAAVTYTAQRAESLMTFWFLLTLHAFIRGIDSPHPRSWRTLAVTACFAGAATKEVMAVAPLVILLYDRTFVAGSFRAALMQRGSTHGLLAASWLLIAWLTLGGAGRAGTAGFATEISSWHYALTQCGAITHYLRLCVWPDALIFDHGTALVTQLSQVGPQAALLLGLLGATAYSLRRYPALGFLGAVFFLLLAPSSSVLPVATQTVAEHRMYLPLAIVIILLLVALRRWAGWRAAVATAAFVAPLLAFATHRRNVDYRSGVALWEDTVRKRPDNARAFVHLGIARVRAGDHAGAFAALESAVRLAPDNSEAHTNLGNLHLAAGRTDEALQAHAEAVRLRPDSAPARASLGYAHLAADRPGDALPAFEEARRLDSDLPGVEHGLGLALLQLARPGEALPHLERVAHLTRGSAEAHFNVANALIALQRAPEAITALETVLGIDPSHIPAHNNLGNLLLLSRRPHEAVPHFQAVVQAHPASAPAHTNLGLALLLARDSAGAERHLVEAVRLDPNYAPARTNLERLQSAK